jgi:EpsI family protein
MASSDVSALPATRPGAYVAGLTIAALLVLTCIFYWRTVEGAWHRGTAALADFDDRVVVTFAAVALLLVHRWWCERERIAIKPSISAIAAVAFASLIWFAAVVANVSSLEELALVAILSLLPIAILGLRIGSAFALPFLLLITVIGIFATVNPLLQGWTATGATFLLKTFNIPVVRDEFFLSVPAGNFEVADYCSGQRQFGTALVLAAGFAYYIRTDLLSGFVLLVLAGFGALLANILRVFIIIGSTEVWGMESPLIKDHGWLGWLVFFFAIVAVFWSFSIAESNRWIPKIGRNKGAQSDDTHLNDAEAFPVIRVALLVAALVYTPIALGLYDEGASNHQIGQMALPPAIGEWTKMDPAESGEDVSQAFFAAEASSGGEYVSRLGEIVTVWLGANRREAAGREAVHFSNKPFDERRWIAESMTRTDVPTSSGGSMRVNETVIRGKGDTRRVVWQWYYTNGEGLATPGLVKLEYLLGLLSGRPGIGVVVISTEAKEGLENGRTTLARFLEEAAPELQGQLRTAVKD